MNANQTVKQHCDYIAFRRKCHLIARREVELFKLTEVNEEIIGGVFHLTGKYQDGKDYHFEATAQQLENVSLDDAAGRELRKQEFLLTLRRFAAVMGFVLLVAALWLIGAMPGVVEYLKSK